MNIPEIRFAMSGDVHIAYQVIGDGPVDVVKIPDWISNLELQWENPLYAHFLERLASFSRVLLFDKRGHGLSDRTVDEDLFTLEVRIDDVSAVMDAAGSEEAIIFGLGDDGGALAAVFAAARPERTRGLLLYAARARMMKAPDYPYGYGPAESDVWARERESFWASDAFARRRLQALAPSVANDDRMVRWYSRFLRQSARAPVPVPRRHSSDRTPRSTCAACSRRSTFRRSSSIEPAIRRRRSGQAATSPIASPGRVSSSFPASTSIRGPETRSRSWRR